MFTGLVETLGVIRQIQQKRSGASVHIEGRFDALLAVGDSVSVSGACLTVESATQDAFVVFASEETLKLTTLNAASAGKKVNLERALKIGDRLGGHFVTGHVDGRGRIRQVVPHAEAHRLDIQVPQKMVPLLPPKGSVTVDGVSLTINVTQSTSISMMVIPHTWKATTFQYLRVGDEVNIEVDVLARYIAAALGPDREDRLRRVLESF